MMFNRIYVNTRHISIPLLIGIRLGYLFEKISQSIIKPKYCLNDVNVVLELDYKNSTIKRVYPNPLDVVVHVDNIHYYQKGYFNEMFYSKESAIAMSKSKFKDLK